MARKLIFPLQHELNQALGEISSNDHFRSIERITIIFRISGDARDFEGDGPERLRYLKKGNELTADLVIPASKWKFVPTKALRIYIKDNFNVIWNWMIEKAESLEEGKDIQSLSEKVYAIMEKFGQHSDVNNSGNHSQ